MVAKMEKKEIWVDGKQDFATKKQTVKAICQEFRVMWVNGIFDKQQVKEFKDLLEQEARQISDLTKPAQEMSI